MNIYIYHYSTGAMRNMVYASKKQVPDNIQTLRNRSIFVLMNLGDAASRSTATPFTTWNKKVPDCRRFGAFVDSCITPAGFVGISPDGGHKAVDNIKQRIFLIDGAYHDILIRLFLDRRTTKDHWFRTSG